MTIYRTNEWKGHGKQNYFWNEYRHEDNSVVKYRCHRMKFFNGDENVWEQEEKEEQSWEINDPDLPEWLRRYL